MELPQLQRQKYSYTSPFPSREGRITIAESLSLNKLRDSEQSNTYIYPKRVKQNLNT